MLPFVSKRLVSMTASDVKTLLQEPNPLLSTLSQHFNDSAHNIGMSYWQWMPSYPCMYNLHRCWSGYFELLSQQQPIRSDQRGATVSLCVILFTRDEIIPVQA